MGNNLTSYPGRHGRLQSMQGMFQNKPENSLDCTVRIIYTLEKVYLDNISVAFILIRLTHID
jgi:hypothetical protein